jgi:peptidoglycan/LPS O-acetylase OafA/YrhL
VALFFVISGFLLYRPFVAARHAGRSGPHIRRYARRRALRILPAYWLALTCLAIWPGLTGVFTGDWWVYYGLLANLRTEWIGGGIQAAWSLCVEMQFYVLLPFYALAAARLLRGRPALFQAQVEYGALALLAAGSLILRMATFNDPAPDTVSSTIAGTFTWFAAGMAIAVASARWYGTPVATRPPLLRLVARRPLLPWLAALGLLLAVTQIGMPTMSLNDYDGSDWLFGHLFYAAIALCAALPAMLGEPARGGLPARVLSWRPVAWLGLVSYGIFLWHQPLTEQFLSVQDWTSHGSFFVYTGVVFVVATACATASYYLVERPLLRFKDPRGARPTGSSARARANARSEPEASPAR